MPGLLLRPFFREAFFGPRTAPLADGWPKSKRAGTRHYVFLCVCLRRTSACFASCRRSLLERIETHVFFCSPLLSSLVTCVSILSFLCHIVYETFEMRMRQDGTGRRHFVLARGIECGWEWGMGGGGGGGGRERDLNGRPRSFRELHCKDRTVFVLSVMAVLLMVLFVSTGDRLVASPLSLSLLRIYFLKKKISGLKKERYRVLLPSRSRHANRGACEPLEADCFSF